MECYEQLKSDLDTHIKDMDSLSGIPPECIPCNYRSGLKEVLEQWEELGRDVNDKQVPYLQLLDTKDLFYSK